MGDTSVMRQLCEHYKVPALGQLPPAALIYPQFYPRNSFMWTVDKLDYLSTANRKMVCAELREVFLKEGKQAYAEHLLRRVRELGSNEQKEETRGEKPQLPQRMQERLNRIQSSRGNRQTILGMSEGA